MTNDILAFLEAYKRLDELCKQIFLSDRGVSKYIDEMSGHSNGHLLVSCWENDYKELKRLRGIRNQLVHEADSFQNNLVTSKDIEWLETFRARILECTDPYALFCKSMNNRKIVAAKVKCFPKSGNEEKENANGFGILIGTLVLAGILLCAILFPLWLM